MAKDKGRRSPAIQSPAEDTAEQSATLVADGLRQLSDSGPETDGGGNPGPASMAASLSQDPQLLEEFLLESAEHLSNIEAKLLEIEQGATSPETLNSAFRSFHTLKGLAGFLDFVVIQDVAHEVETLLDLARNGQLTLGERQV
jgi:two-component system chemotaxis sensor kinase CheA